MSKKAEEKKKTHVVHSMYWCKHVQLFDLALDTRGKEAWLHRGERKETQGRERRSYLSTRSPITVVACAKKGKQKPAAVVCARN